MSRGDSAGFAGFRPGAITTSSKQDVDKKKKPTAKLTLVVTDSAGNAQTNKYSVRLKP